VRRPFYDKTITGNQTFFIIELEDLSLTQVGDHVE